MKYGLAQSAVFGLGIIAQRVPKGQYAVLDQVLPLLNDTIKTQVPEGVGADEKESI